MKSGRTGCLARAAGLVFLGGGALGFVLLFYDGGFVFDTPKYLQIYALPASTRQIALISQPDFLGDRTDYWVAARASPGAKWRLLSHSFAAPGGGLQNRKPLESRKLGCWRWQDADLKQVTGK